VPFPVRGFRDSGRRRIGGNESAPFRPGEVHIRRRGSCRNGADLFRPTVCPASAFNPLSPSPLHSFLSSDCNNSAAAAFSTIGARAGDGARRSARNKRLFRGRRTIRGSARSSRNPANSSPSRMLRMPFGTEPASGSSNQKWKSSDFDGCSAGPVNSKRKPDSTSGEVTMSSEHGRARPVPPVSLMNGQRKLLASAAGGSKIEA